MLQGSGHSNADDARPFPFSTRRCQGNSSLPIRRCRIAIILGEDVPEAAVHVLDEESPDKIL